MGSIGPPQDDAQHKHHRRVYLLTAPRTASNLFVKILNIHGQPNADCGKFYGGYFFMPAFLLRDHMDKWDIPVNDLPKDDLQTIGSEMQKGLDTYREFLETTEREGKIAFVKEHVGLMTKPTITNEYIHGIPAASCPEPWPLQYEKGTSSYESTNPTVIPDHILHTFQPTFLIRHPALQIPSLHRAQREGRDLGNSPSDQAGQKSSHTLKTLRDLYDFYASHFAKVDPTSPWPLIIDGTDFINNPAPIMKHFCELNGFDFSACQFSWDPVSTESLATLNKMSQRALSTLNASTGVQIAKATASVDIDAEARNWRTEFGEDQGRRIEKHVRDAMPDYEYLHARRWVCPPELEAAAPAMTNGARKDIPI